MKVAQCKFAILVGQKATSHCSSDVLDQLLASVGKFVSETSSKEVKTLLVAQCKGLSDVPNENKLAAAKRVLKLLAQHKADLKA